MKFGVCVPNYGTTLSVDGLRTVALQAETFGYDSIWTTDHLLMPTNTETPWYETIFDSITCLAYLAPLTNKVKLGISSLILAMRNPAVVAKQLATIDQLSGGRLILATSAGWVEDEFVHLGSNFHSRGKRLNESIKLIRALWGGSGEFEGKTIPHSFSKPKFEPQPIQAKLIIWIAGNSRAAMKRAIILGDAWHPNAFPLDVFRKMVSEFRKIPGGETKQICVRIPLNHKATESEYVHQGERRLVLSGNASANEEIIAEFQKLNVSNMILVTNYDGAAEIQEQLQSLKEFADRFL